MNEIRSFIAIELSAAIHQKLDEMIRRWKENRIQGIRWVPAHNIHLTLKFLGDVSPAQMGPLNQMLKTQVSSQPGFTMTIRGIGAFPNAHRPRVVWVGVEAPPELAALARLVEHETHRLGFQAEDRPFSPHLTVGRVSQQASPDEVKKIGGILAGQPAGLLGTCDVREVTLFRSDLRPSGAEYTALIKIPLRV